ncbi:unnamed protein product, partial [Prorocentrum cordatum]
MLPGPEEESDAPAGVQPSPRHDAAPDGGSPLGGEGPSASAAREAEEELAVLRAALAGRGGQGGVPGAAGDGPEAPRPRATPPAPEGCPPELLVCGAPAPDACRSPAAAGRTPDQRGLAASRGISLASSSAGSAASQPSSVTSGSRCSSPAGRAAAPMSASMVPLAGSLRWGIPVLLHIYDVSQADSIQRLNSFLANRRCPVKLGGVFHAGVEVAGMEWSFGQTEDDATPGVSPNPPREHPAHRFRQTVELPRARLSVADIQEVIAELAKVTAVLARGELPLFLSWRCHARRLGLPFVATAGSVAVHAALCGLADAARGEAAWLGGAAGSSLSLLAGLLALVPDGSGVLFVRVDTALLRLPPWTAGRRRAGRGAADLLFWPEAAGACGTCAGSLAALWARGAGRVRGLLAGAARRVGAALAGAGSEGEAE